MGALPKKRKEIFKWIIIAGLILVFLFLLSKSLITGNAINETTNSTCKLAWQSCPNGDECCEGLSCLGGTCKVETLPPSENQTFNQTSNQTSNVTSPTCKLAWQSCPNGNECCEGLSCLGGTCKVKLNDSEKIENISTSVTCNNIGQSCELSKDCCDKLICSGGLCAKKELICVDSDGGKNPYLKGHAVGFNEEKVYFSSLADKCLSNENVEEAYCEENIAKLETIPCINGCENGICNCKSSTQSCNSSLECCSGFNCMNKTCISQTEKIPTTLKNKVLCTFIGQPCGSNEDCCSKNCISDWKFLSWESDVKTCGKVIIK